MQKNFTRTEDNFSKGGENRMRKPTRIKLARIQIGLQAKEAASLLGISASHLSNLEGGRREISIETLQRMARIYHVDAKSLI